MPPFVTEFAARADEPCVLEDLATGARFVFHSGISIGRDPGCELQLEHPLVSGHHAIIERRDGAWQLHDQHSTNGTSLDGRRITDWARLEEGQVIRFAGSLAWRVVRLVEAADGPPPTAAPQQVPGDLVLELAWESEDEGTIRVRWAGATHQVTMAKPFYLLFTLARSPGELLDDEDLIIAVWGPARFDLKSAETSLWQLAHQLRRQFAAWRIPGQLIVKRNKRTMLDLGPHQVHILG